MDANKNFEKKVIICKLQQQILKQQLGRGHHLPSTRHMPKKFKQEANNTTQHNQTGAFQQMKVNQQTMGGCERNVKIRTACHRAI
jgi:hypothetical protein